MLQGFDLNKLQEWVTIYKWRREACSHQNLHHQRWRVTLLLFKKKSLHNSRWQLFTSLYVFSIDQSLYVPAIKRKWLNQLIDTNSCTHMPQLCNPKPQEWSFQYCLPLTSKCQSANKSQFHWKIILWSLTCSSLTLYQDHKLDPIFAMQLLMFKVRGIS